MTLVSNFLSQSLSFPQLRRKKRELDIPPLKKPLQCQNTKQMQVGDEYVPAHARSCLTLCRTMDCSPPGSSAHGILQVRRLEWIAISFSKGSSRPRDRTRVSWVSYTGRQIFTNCVTHTMYGELARTHFLARELSQCSEVTSMGRKS